MLLDPKCGHLMYYPAVSSMYFSQQQPFISPRNSREVETQLYAKLEIERGLYLQHLSRAYFSDLKEHEI